MDMQTVTTVLEGIGAPAYEGYAPTNAKVPYVVHRPFLLDPVNLALDGSAMDWDHQFALYCCGGSVEASYNLAKAVVAQVQGKRVGGSTFSTSLGYIGAQVEGHYETQVTIQINQGVL